MTIVAARLTAPTAAAGASGRRRCAPANADANGTPAARPTIAAAMIASGSGRAIASRPIAKPPTTKLICTTRGRSSSRPPAGRDTTPRNSTSPPTSPATCADSSPPRCSSVATQLPSTTESPNDAACMTPSGSSRRSKVRGRLRGTGLPLVRGREEDEHEPDRRDDRRGRERRTPARPQRHEREGEAARRHRRGAVEALRDRRGERRTHVVGAADERGGEADAGDEADPDREPRLAPGEARERREPDQHEPAGADETRSEAVAEPARGDLHGGVGERRARS